jgi:hypothetical protein
MDFNNPRLLLTKIPKYFVGGLISTLLSLVRVFGRTFIGCTERIENTAAEKAAACGREMPYKGLRTDPRQSNQKSG